MLDELLKLEDARMWSSRESQKWWALHDELAGFSTAGDDTADQSQVGQTIAIDVLDRT